jgi:hypothetical protein
MMNKVIIILLLIISIIVSIVMVICAISSYINEDNYHLLFLMMFLISLIFVHVRVRDYKYWNGKLSYKQFTRHNRYEYWFLMYGEKAYDKYLESFK